MWNNFRILPTTLLRRPQQYIQPQRTTFVVKRTKPIRLNKLGGRMFPHPLKRRNYYYELVEDRNCKKKPPVDVVLTSDVTGVGLKAENVKMNIYIAYRDLLLPKLGLLASLPEAKSIIKTTQEKQYSSKYSKIVENYLANQPVKIVLSHDTQWILKPWHVKMGLRNIGIYANEDCISIPKEITGPNTEIENKDFLVHLTMNKSEKFTIRCRIYHWSTVEPLLNHKTMDIHSPSEALFEDEKEMIASIINIEKEIKRSKMIRGETTEQKTRRKKKKKC